MSELEQIEQELKVLQVRKLAICNEAERKVLDEILSLGWAMGKTFTYSVSSFGAYGGNEFKLLMLEEPELFKKVRSHITLMGDSPHYFDNLVLSRFDDFKAFYIKTQNPSLMIDFIEITKPKIKFEEYTESQIAVMDVAKKYHLET